MPLSVIQLIGNEYKKGLSMLFRYYPSNPSMDEQLMNTIVYCIGSNIISIVGIIGNCVGLFVLYPSKLHKAKSVFYGYLTALAASDLLFLFVNVVFRYKFITSVFFS